MVNAETDLMFMERCIALARAALERGDAPFGSLIANGTELVAEGINNRQFRVSEHAEIIALNNAAVLMGSNNLSACTLYTSCEPCPMCSFMIREFHISRVVFGMHSMHMGGISRWPILSDSRLNKLGQIFGPPPEIIGGILGAEAGALMAETPLIHYFVNPDTAG
jgi:tRNA(adenine34) deaminase